MAACYYVDKPYPMPVGLGENKRCAHILLKCYCGCISEMTTMNQYMYHYQLALAKCAPAAAALQGICAVEMQHMYLLGRCICQMGVNPKYRIINESGPVNWSVRYVHYEKTVREMLLADIKNEEDSIKLYEASIRRTNNTQIKALLERIIEDEQLHVVIFTDLYNQYF